MTIQRQAILEVRGLGLSYGAFQAVDGVDLRIERGTIHAIIGPNGAGKTSLFRCLTGERRSTRGTILFDGEDITAQPAEARVGLGMPRSFQITSLFNALSVKENLRLAAQGLDGWKALNWWQYAHKRKHHIEVAEKVMERLGLTQYAAIPAGELSHGQQRMLEIGMGLCADPKLIVLDEPTSGMGVDDIPRMTEFIQELGAERSVLMIEHNMSIVMNISDKVTVMSRGKVLVEGSPDMVRQDERVKVAYLGEPV